MNTKQKRRGQWMFWGLFFLFALPLQVVALAIQRLVLGLPRDHWLGSIISNAVTVVALLGAMFVTTRSLRRRGLSGETKFEMAWPNERFQENAPIATVILRYDSGIRWCVLGCGAFMLAVFGAIYFFIPADKQIGRENVPLYMALIAAAFALFFAFFSMPMARLDVRGIKGQFGRVVLWREIASCRVEVARNVYGDLLAPTITMLGHSEQKLATITLQSPKDQQHKFLLALHHVLQPREDAPDLAQVLEDGPQEPASTST